MALGTSEIETDDLLTHSEIFLRFFVLPTLVGLLFGVGFSVLAIYQETEATNTVLHAHHIFILFAVEVSKALFFALALSALAYFYLYRPLFEKNRKTPSDEQTPYKQETLIHVNRKLAQQENELTDIKQRLSYAKELFDAAFYSNSQLQSISDFDTGRFVDVNDSWVEVRGISRDEAIGKTADELNIWGGAVQREKLLKDISELGRLRNYETVSVMRNGELRDFIINAEVISLKGRKLLFFSGLDFTDQKKIRLNLQHAQKLDAVGLLTGGIAHDFNNLLAIILGNLELANEVTSDNPKAQKLIKSAIIGTQRGASITDKLLSFSGGRPSGKEVTQINPLLEGMEELIAKSVTASINVQTLLDADAWPVEIDPGDFEDVIINLTLNAQDSMPGGGKLVIETYNKYLDDRYVNFNPMAKTGEHLAIRITDTGHGIEENVRERIFEPFFTTKERGKGTGLGLSMTFGFVKRSGGHIRVDSKVGHGTSFTLYLPRSKQTKVTVPLEQKTDHMPLGSETILIVEDEVALSDIARSTLNKLGYVTHCAQNGSEALKVLENNPNIDLMFSDIVMPGTLNGFELATSAKKSFPKTKILLTSGFTREDTLPQSSKSDDLAHLKKSLLGKPYNRQQLAVAVRNAIDEA